MLAAVASNCPAGRVSVALALGLSLAGSARADCDEQSSRACNDETRWAAFPFLGYEPEMGWILGGFVQRYFDSPGAGRTQDEPRRSYVSLAALGTTKRQFAVELEPTLYTDHGRWRFSALFSGSVFPDSYYAPGPHSPRSSQERFEGTTLRLAPTLERQLLRNFYLGWTSQLASQRLTYVEPGGALAAGTVVGARGGQIFGMGPVVAWDDRDRDFSAREGGRYEARMLTHPRWLGTDYGYSLFTVDLRRFESPWPGHVFAAQLFSSHAGGSVPFTQLPALGGNGRMRGFLSTRYHDLHTLSAQLEYRLHVFWRFGAVAFAGAGDVAPRMDAFVLSRARYSGGGGLRFALNPEDGVNLRLDFGFSSEGDDNVYFTIGEAF